MKKAAEQLLFAVAVAACAAMSLMLVFLLGFVIALHQLRGHTVCLRHAVYAEQCGTPGVVVDFYAWVLLKS